MGDALGVILHDLRPERDDLGLIELRLTAREPIEPPGEALRLEGRMVESCRRCIEHLHGRLPPDDVVCSVAAGWNSTASIDSRLTPPGVAQSTTSPAR